jgi:hypothetical protein
MALATKTCKTCAFCVKVDKVSGFCRRFPPAVMPDTSSCFPPVRLKDFWCGEHKAKDKA